MDRRIPLETRLWSRVNKAGPTMPRMTTPCWQWTGALTAAGYGQISAGGAAVNGAKKYAVHRLVYETLVGPVPPGLSLDHLCRNRACCRPEHLDPVTPQENALRGVGPAAIRAAKTHCPQGHEYSDENTYRDKKNRRYCRTCLAATNRRLRAEGYWRPGGPGYDREKNAARMRERRARERAA